MTKLIEHQVNRNNIRETRWYEYEAPPLEDGDVLLAIDKFAMTANNVTYAAFGDMMQYWNFFPANDGWGRVPMWGFATVAESKAEGVTPGQRVYGYVPASNAFIARKVTSAGIAFRDNADKRVGLSPIYNTYTFTTDDPAYTSDTEAQQMLFRPLFATGWWLADLICRHPAELKSALITSASSKTSLSMAWSLNSKDMSIETIGLTSSGNVDFTDGTGVYARTLSYDQIPGMQAAAPSSVTDMRGSPAIRAAVHTALESELAASITVGATEWEAKQTSEPLPGIEPEFFFAPDYIAKRMKEEGPAISSQVTADLVRFYEASKAFVTPKTSTGADAIEAAWQTCLEGSVPPDTGLILTL